MPRHAHSSATHAHRVAARTCARSFARSLCTAVRLGLFSASAPFSTPATFSGFTSNPSLMTIPGPRGGLSDVPSLTGGTAAGAETFSVLVPSLLSPPLIAPNPLSHMTSRLNETDFLPAKFSSPQFSTDFGMLPSELHFFSDDLQGFELRLRFALTEPSSEVTSLELPRKFPSFERGFFLVRAVFGRGGLPVTLPKKQDDLTLLCYRAGVRAQLTNEVRTVTLNIQRLTWVATSKTDCLPHLIGLVSPNLNVVGETAGWKSNG